MIDGRALMISKIISGMLRQPVLGHRRRSYIRHDCSNFRRTGKQYYLIGVARAKPDLAFGAADDSPLALTGLWEAWKDPGHRL
jgi:hypothetical protein